MFYKKQLLSFLRLYSFEVSPTVDTEMCVYMVEMSSVYKSMMLKEYS